MKKIWLTFAGSCLIALATVNAQERSDTTQTQQPSSGYRTESGTQSETGTINGKSGTQGQYSTEWSDQDRETVSREDLPSGLLKTLESDEYKGWENATIYRNKVSDDYMLIIQDNGTAKTFYFDKEGKSHSDLNSSGMNSDSSSSGYNSSSTSGSSSSGTTQSGTSGSGSMNNNSTSGTSDSGTSGYGTQGSPSGSAGTSGSMNSSSSSGSTSTPSTGYRTEDSSVGTSDESVGVQTTEPSQSQAWNNEDRVIIVNEDIPANLRVTLQGDQFKGWENSTIFQNRKTNEYMIEIRDGSNAKVYYFDKEGKILSNTGNND
jgi:hypothetical protein